MRAVRPERERAAAVRAPLETVEPREVESETSKGDNENRPELDCQMTHGATTAPEDIQRSI